MDPTKPFHYIFSELPVASVANSTQPSPAVSVAERIEALPPPPAVTLTENMAGRRWAQAPAHSGMEDVARQTGITSGQDSVLEEIYGMPDYNPAHRTPLHAICYLLDHSTDPRDYPDERIFDLMVRYENACTDTALLQAFFEKLSHYEALPLELNPDVSRVFSLFVSRLCATETWPPAQSLIGPFQNRSLLTEEASAALRRKLPISHFVEYISALSQKAKSSDQAFASGKLLADLLIWSGCSEYYSYYMRPQIDADSPLYAGFVHGLLTSSALSLDKRFDLCVKYCHWKNHFLNGIVWFLF